MLKTWSLLKLLGGIEMSYQLVERYQSRRVFLQQLWGIMGPENEYVLCGVILYHGAMVYRNPVVSKEFSFLVKWWQFTISMAMSGIDWLEVLVPTICFRPIFLRPIRFPLFFLTCLGHLLHSLPPKVSIHEAINPMGFAMAMGWRNQKPTAIGHHSYITLWSLSIYLSIDLSIDLREL